MSVPNRPNRSLIAEAAKLDPHDGVSHDRYLYILILTKTVQINLKHGYLVVEVQVSSS